MLCIQVIGKDNAVHEQNQEEKVRRVESKPCHERIVETTEEGSFKKRGNSQPSQMMQ